MTAKASVDGTSQRCTGDGYSRPPPRVPSASVCLESPSPRSHEDACPRGQGQPYVQDDVISNHTCHELIST